MSFCTIAHCRCIITRLIVTEYVIFSALVQWCRFTQQLWNKIKAVLLLLSRIRTQHTSATCGSRFPALQMVRRLASLSLCWTHWGEALRKWVSGSRCCLGWVLTFKELHTNHFNTKCMCTTNQQASNKPLTIYNIMLSRALSFWLLK